jgi:hypothetical protein
MINLSEHDSSAHMLDAVERHQRLCRQTPYGEKFEMAIQPFYNELKTKNNNRKNAENERMSAYDIVRLNDLIMDDLLRKVYNRSQEYDRSTPGANTLTLLFAGGKLSPILSMPYDKEPNEAYIIAQKLENLGNSHVLYPIAAEIYQSVTTCHAGLKKMEDAIRIQATTWAEEEMAKIALCRQYEKNYHNASIEYNKYFAEKLFPVIKGTVKREVAESPVMAETSK